MTTQTVLYSNGRRMTTFFYEWNIFERRLSDKWGFCIDIVSDFLSSIFFTVSFSAIEWNTSTWNWTPSRSLQISISMTLFIWRRCEATMGNAIHMEIFQKREIRLVLPATGVLPHYCKATEWNYRYIKISKVSEMFMDSQRLCVLS
jgi:hypothetical protein